MTKLAEVTFVDRVEDLPDPVAVGTYLPERKKLLEVRTLLFILYIRYITTKQFFFSLLGYLSGRSGIRHFGSNAKAIPVPLLSILQKQTFATYSQSHCSS